MDEPENSVAQWWAEQMRAIDEDRREELIVAAGDKVFDLRPLLEARKLERRG